ECANSVGLKPADLRAGETHATAVRYEKAIEDIEQSGFAGPVWADNSIDYPLGHAQGHTINRLEATERARHVVKLQDWLAKGRARHRVCRADGWARLCHYSHRGCAACHNAITYLTINSLGRDQDNDDDCEPIHNTLDARKNVAKFCV